MLISNSKNLIILLLIFIITGSGIAGELNIGTDIYNRYVWRGTDFGNSAAIQPYISYSSGPFEFGAWSSWSINGAPGGNENDLYLSYTYNFLSLAITDYFFPGYTGDDMIDEFGEQGGHTFEFSAGFEFSGFNLLAAANIAGNDPDNSKYIELGYRFFEKQDITAALFTGAGDYIYSINDDFTVVNVGLNITKDIYSASYIINPDQKTSFLTFGVSF